MIKALHPFPARMGPDLAIDRLKRLKIASTVLDPMAGSGTVLRHAAEYGHTSIGRDLDPLAILIARVWTTPLGDEAIGGQYAKLLDLTREIDPKDPLPWIDGDAETRQFTEYWFAEPQRNDLRRLAGGLKELAKRRRREQDAAAIDVLRLALSRIIITKDSGASLGRDVSHSRPHKVADETSYQVMPGFELSVRQLRERLAAQPPPGRVAIAPGDARKMDDIPDRSIDVVLSSPPYLNAIDYMRAHRMTLVWLGYRLGELRRIRAVSIGSERGPDQPQLVAAFKPILDALGDVGRLPGGDRGMIRRYAEDMYRLTSEIARVLKNDGRAYLVVGNSCLRKVFINNSEGFVAAGRMVGLRMVRRVERELPTRKRYLPMPEKSHEPLGQRMRTETVLTFKRA
jgi:SAM-dependent methyltransferase